MKIAVSDDKAFSRAWWALIATPFTFWIAFFIGEGMGSAMGYDADTNPPGALGAIAITAVALAVMLPAPVLSLKYSLQARRAGYGRATIPAVLSGFATFAIIWMLIGSLLTFLISQK